jgi:hypothetical protein
MRKIETGEQIERRRKRNAKIGGIIMLLILVISSAGYAFISSDSETGGNKSGGVYGVGDRWALDVNGGTLYFSHSLENVSDIIVDTSFSLNDYYQKPLYVVSDNPIITNEVGLSLGKYVIRMQNACYENCTSDLPEKNCSDNLIVYNPKIENKVYQKDNCIFIDGDLRAVDAFLYRIVGY